MKGEMSQRGLIIFIATLFLWVIALSGLAGWTSADENIPVTCYRDSSRIGTVTVFDWRTATATCNAILYDCRGACMGCFRDYDYIDDICVDMNGREFLR